METQLGHSTKFPPPGDARGLFLSLVERVNSLLTLCPTVYNGMPPNCCHLKKEPSLTHNTHRDRHMQISQNTYVYKYTHYCLSARWCKCDSTCHMAKRRECATIMVARCSGFGRHAVLATSSSRLSVTPQNVCTHMSHYTKPIVGNVSNAH